MSWQYVPGQIRIPKVPFWDPPEGIWRGVDYDERLFAYRNSISSFGSYVVVESTELFPSVVLDGSKMTPQFTDVNGYICWTGSRNLYYSQTYGWIVCDQSPGYEPLEEQRRDPESGMTTWEGDSFWVLSSFPYGEDSEATLTPRGKERGKESKKLKLTWKRWVCNQEFGVYEGKGGASGKKIVGLPQFRGNGETFLRSLEKDNSWHFTYGRIHYASGKWVIGEVGSAAGWHEGSEPKADGGSVTFSFCRPEGSDVTGQNITVSFEKYVGGDEKDIAYLGEAAVWR